MGDLTNIKVGDTLFLVRTAYRREPLTSFEVVTKVGRKWIYLGDGFGAVRVNRETGRCSDFLGTSDAAYRSQAEYEETVDADKAWREFRRLVSGFYSRPAHIDASTVRALLAALAGKDVE